MGPWRQGPIALISFEERHMQGMLEKLRRDALNMPERVVYDFLDCQSEPYAHNAVTMAQLYHRAMNMAAELKRRGAQKGDRAIIFSLQDAGTVYAIFGCMLAGVVFTVIPPPIDPGKLTRFISVLKSCGAKFLISNAAMEKTSDTDVKGPLLRRAFFQAVSLRRIYTDQLPEYDGPELFCEHQPDDLLYLQYTSGSTSDPKGVMVTYGALNACIDQCKLHFDFTVGDHNLASWVPFYHAIGLLLSLFLPLIADHGIAYLIPTLQFIARPTIWLKIMSDYRINITGAPNSAYDICSQLISKEAAGEYDLSHVTHLINGSEFVHIRTVDRFCELFGLSKDVFAVGYGLSECVCVATLGSNDFRCITIDPAAYAEGRFVPSEHGGKAIVGVGRPTPEMTVLAVRPDGSPCAAGEIGEIYISGPSVCVGYWKTPEETQRFSATVKGLPGTFYRTGDMGVMHDGTLFLTGRCKEMIVIGGRNIYPGDITLLLHEQGLELPGDAIAVFALSTEGGEKPVLCAECGNGADFPALAAQINHIAADGLGFSFYNVAFVAIGALPRTDNRKLKTLAVRDAYEENRLPLLFSTGLSPGQEGTEEAEIDLSAEMNDQEMRGAVRALFQQMLKQQDFSDEDSFLELGGDSLRMMELLCCLEQRLNITVDLRKIVAHPCVSGVAAYVQRLLSGAEIQLELNLWDECRLDDSITPESEYTLQPEQCRNIFLTGSTGFLGAYLLSSLLEQRREDDVIVYCHARAQDEAAAMERIIKNMQAYSCWKEEYRHHIIPVPGDLELPGLGIEPALYSRLTQEADMVIHNGAMLNFILPYERMKGANVLGTAECLRLACSGRAKYFHYISSYSVYDTLHQLDKTVLESDPLSSPEGYFLGYSETKWVAEKLVGIARQRGLRANIYRPGDITGDLKNGMWKLEDLISRSIVGCIQMAAVPQIDINLHLTPVDFVSDAIVAIAFQSPGVNKAFNIINQNTLPLRQIHQLIGRAGYRATELPYGEWRQRLLDCPADQNVLRILSCLFADAPETGVGLVERFGSRQPHYDCHNTESLLAGTGIICPPVDGDMIDSYLNSFRERGYIKAPAAS